jgi:hypothetical protein
MFGAVDSFKSFPTQFPPPPRIQNSRLKGPDINPGPRTDKSKKVVKYPDRHTALLPGGKAQGININIFYCKKSRIKIIPSMR